ncbi:MAG TPA: mandelate racemase/muconate lactonizing enzyme family protein [Candidatus Dormibacteraeota bacterium]|nr:mandelate racemase/muconate lactonizing enzyme family protein [Candidatus Dormibacteraeota bacterium]
MKITEVKSFALQAKQIDKRKYWGSRAWGREDTVRGELSNEYPPPQRRRCIYSPTIDTVLVKITTDDGLVGYGEAKAPVAPQATKNIVDLLLTDIVLGADPRDTTVLWERMYAGMRIRGHRAGFYLEAISGVDIALWDLAGKAAGVPIYQLTGGCFRNPVRVYASGLPALDISAPSEAFEGLAEDAEAIRRQGYTGLKMALGRGLSGDLKSVRTVREKLGSEFIIYADAAGTYDRAQALRLGRELEELGVGFFELPIFPEDIDGYVELAKALTIPIAMDTLTSRYETRDFVSRGGLDIVQPDVCRAGGVTECKRIAELADAFGVAFAPHVSIGSAIHFAATAHLATSMPNTITSEYWIGENPLGNCILKGPLVLENGYMYTPSGPGLGIEINEETLPL